MKNFLVASGVMLIQRGTQTSFNASSSLNHWTHSSQRDTVISSSHPKDSFQIFCNISLGQSITGETNANGSNTFLDDIRSDSEDGDTLSHQDESSSDFSVDEGPQPFSQSQFNDLVRDLGLSKGPTLKNKNLLTPDTSFSWYRHREKEFTQFFSKKGNLIFCNDVQGLKKCFDVEYDPSEWCLFIDSSKTSLKEKSCCIMVIHLHCF
ncbi:hypothetical protein AVEN_139182-1 [Araneus ventricosus]|uniref:Uncharacterized protein n=1 Tax=Araneus ventricosus TaxID=182803 RepID=A0A4Y2WAC3_ARAVE|nr:hypothetical protein AVEN_139182-1 [Araneus ventricosus]